MPRTGLILIEKMSRTILDSKNSPFTKAIKLYNNVAETYPDNPIVKEKLANLQAVVEEKVEKKSLGERLQAQKKAVESNLTFDEENRNAELNIIGKRVDEAEDEVDKFLDESFMSGFRFIRIVHGIGTGALRNAVHQMLKGHPHVQKFTLANQNEGGNGATVVELKQ